MKRIFCALLAGALTLGAALPVQAADKAVLRVAADAKQTAISDHLYGAFIDDISYACDGGLVSNLVNNDSFEYASAPTTGWVADGLELTTEGNLPLNKNNPTYAKVTVDGKGSLTNLGFTEIYKYKTDKYDKKKANTADMGFVADQVYDFSCYVRSGGFTGTAQVYLDCGDGKQTAVQLDLSKTGGAWNKLTVPLTASASKDGALVFQLEGDFIPGFRHPGAPGQLRLRQRQLEIYHSAQRPVCSAAKFAPAVYPLSRRVPGRGR